MKKLIDKKRILEQNPKIDHALIIKVEKIESELETVGFHFTPKYSLQLPLGGGKIDSSTRSQLKVALSR